MAENTKFLDATGVAKLWSEVKKRDEQNLTDAKNWSNANLQGAIAYTDQKIEALNTAMSNNYLKQSVASNTYQPIGNYLISHAYRPVHIDGVQAGNYSSTNSDALNLKPGSNISIIYAGNGVQISGNYIDATTNTAGLMSATDKSNLDTLVKLLADNDANTTVDTIREVLNVFASYPEGATIVNALANKLDKAGGTITGDTTVNEDLIVKGHLTVHGDLLDGNGGDLIRANVEGAMSNYFKKSSIVTPDNHQNFIDTYGRDSTTVVSSEGLNNILESYATTNSVSDTYLKQSVASSTYLKQTDASGTYLKQTDASSTYLSKTAGGTITGTVYFGSNNETMINTSGTVSAKKFMQDGKTLDKLFQPVGEYVLNSTLSNYAQKTDLPTALTSSDIEAILI